MRPAALAFSIFVHAAALCAALNFRTAPARVSSAAGEPATSAALVISPEMPSAPAEAEVALEPAAEVLLPLAEVAAPDAKLLESAEADVAAAISSTVLGNQVESRPSVARRPMRRTSRATGSGSGLAGNAGESAGNYQAPKYRTCPPPPYPADARPAKLQGGALLLVEVDAQGAVAKVTIRRSTGSTLLDAAAVKAVRTWRFEPARLGARVVAASVEVPVRFVYRG
jgi:protein TonB